MEKILLNISGMHCASCAVTIEAAVKKVPGVINASVNFAAEKAYIEFNPELLSIQDFVSVIKQAGYRALVPAESLDT